MSGAEHLTDAEVVSIDRGRSNVPAVAAPDTPMTMLEITSQCREVEVWAERCTSVPELQDTATKLSVLGDYLARTSKDGRNAIAAARLRIEARIGVLLGPAKVGRPETSPASDDPADDDGLTRNQRSQMRKMADHPDVVEAVIDDSDDVSPASRRKVLDEINRKKHADIPPAPEGEPDPYLTRAATAIASVRSGLLSFDPALLGERADPEMWEQLERLERSMAMFMRKARAAKPAPMRVVKGGRS